MNLRRAEFVMISGGVFVDDKFFEEVLDVLEVGEDARCAENSR